MRQVHEYVVDRSRNIAVLGKVNPARKYVSNESSHVVQLVDGELTFFDQGDQTVAMDEVPEFILAHLKKNPLRRGNETVEQVLRFCPFCPKGDGQNAVASGDYESHLIKHAKDFSAKAAPAADDEPAPKAKAARK